MAKSQHLYTLILFAFSLAFFAAGGYGLYRWAKDANYMTAKGIIPAGVKAFTPINLSFLTLFAFATPIGLYFFIYSLTHAARYCAFNPNKPSQKPWLCLFGYSIVLMIGIGSFGFVSYSGYFWAKNVLQCGFIACLNQDKWPQPDTLNVSKDSEGFKAAIAAPIILIIIPLAITFLVMIFHQIYMLCSTPRPWYNSKTDRLLDSINNDSSSIDLHSQTTTTETMSYTPYNTYYQITRTKSGQQVAPVVNSTSPVTIRLVIIGVLLIISSILLFILSSYVPGSFRHYWPRLAASKSAIKISHQPLQCIEKGSYSCPEHQNAMFHSFGIEINENLVLKLFPSNIIFYTFILLAITFPLITRLIPTLDKYLQKKVTFSVPTIFFWHYYNRKPFASMTKVYFSLYEILLSFWLALGFGIFFMYWFQSHNWKTRWPGSDITTFWDNLYRSTGQISVVILSLLMFPASRSSPILQVLGIGWDKSLNFHRWAGVAFVLMTVIHMATSYISFYMDGGWDGFIEILWPFPPFNSLENQDNFTIPIMQWITWFMLISIGIIAVYEPIRRYKYEFFLICHHITYLTLIPVVLWHAQAAWQYLAPALCLYLSDRLLRLYRGTQAVCLLPTTSGDFEQLDHDYLSQKTNSPFSLYSIDTALPRPDPITSIHSSLKKVMLPGPHRPAGPGVRIIDCGAGGKFIELRIDNTKTNTLFMPGHFFFINISEISLFEWHPMTTSGHVHARSHELSFLIKCEGDSSSWTNALYSYIEEKSSRQLPSSDPNALLNIPLTISLDGPYGQPIDFNQYDNVVLIAGGSGITPAKSIFDSMWLSFLHDFLATPDKAILHKQLLEQVKETNIAHNIPLGSDIMQYNSVDSFDAKQKHISLPKHVHLFFVAKSPEIFECMTDSLAHIPSGAGVPFTAELLCSQNGSLVPIETDNDDLVLNSPTYDPKTKVYHNIPQHISKQRQDDIKLETSTPLAVSVCTALGVKSLQDIKNPERTLFFACGPDRLVHHARELAVEHGFSTHDESFLI